nr:multicopper oxidase domain-containing protein [Saccharomonospora iraqiensis]
MLVGTAAGVVTPVAVSSLGAAAATADPGNGRAPGNAGRGDGRLRRITMYAEKLPDGMIGYGLEPGGATVPGPVLEIWEGDTLEIELVNTTDKRLSIHPHGVDYSVDSDGAPLNGSFNEPGETRTYVWRTRAPSKGPGKLWMPGSAGYWHYHDHAMGTPHGTEGLRKGLYGALVVRRKGDVLPDRQFTVVFNDMTINNRVAPDVPVLEANLGERVEFIAIGHGNNFHTFHLHAHRWADNRTGYLEGPNDPSRVIDNRDLNPGDSIGFQVLAGDGVGPGAWMYHCHVQFHSDGGMAGVFLVRNADGSMPEGAREALDRYHGHAGG